MNDLREKLADILKANPNGYDAADAIIAALPDMVQPLVWHVTKHTYPDQLGIRAIKWGTHYCIISAPEGGRCVLSSHGEESIGPHYFDNIDTAKAAGQAHYVAQTMAAIGLGVE